MQRDLLAPLAVLLEFDLALHLLLVLVRVIITPLAHGTAEGDQSVSSFNLCHADYNTLFAGLLQTEPMAGFEPATYSLPWSCSTS